MSLGVLNNMSATYAANNLNNTSNSLTNVLQQLSSGSKINSGSDDAAGLSLVNGLQANSQALTQSATNAAEGVGLLKVADGALSQVTNLLNRAVTLATEVSNGTLTGSQQTAANQEYQSILSEINNIGSTTTFNQNKVFGGSDVQVYTGDSSTQSASIDSLHFSSVNSANVGDAGGKMQYSAGQGVFVDLSHSGTLATSNDQFGSAQTLVFDRKNADGSTATPTTINIASTDTVGKVIDEINSAGLGLTASLTTGTLAGDSGAGADTGIMITGQISTTLSTTNMIVDTGSTIQDGASGQTAAATAALGNSGIAQISYNAGGDSSANLNTYDLSSQANAENALTTLNAAVIDVAAQDGYVGSQINTLNAVSQVLSTQQENVQSAQNAVQATDYAQATSAMSKYEILSQTGISALAQANSMQQEVTKLLQ